MEDSDVKNLREVSALAHNMKFLRKLNKMSQDELAIALKIKRSNIAAYESKNVEPRLSVILDIGKLFDISLADLLKEKLSSAEYNGYECIGQKLRQPTELSASSPFKDFQEKSADIRKVLEGFQTYYTLTKTKSTHTKSELKNVTLDPGYIMELMNHLLNLDESLIKSFASREN